LVLISCFIFNFGPKKLARHVEIHEKNGYFNFLKQTVSDDCEKVTKIVKEIAKVDHFQV